MPTPLKQHQIHQSCLYKMLGKGQFEKSIEIEWAAVGTLLQRSEYRVWTTAKGREIQAPYGWMLSVHTRIARLLARIETPEFLFSKKGRSYISNAGRHTGHHPVIKTDISQFYPSITRCMVFRLFRDTFQCAADVSNKLADICCYEGKHLPTGSPLSGYVAFFAAAALFDEINILAKKAGCQMSLYVDDITISGPGATKSLLSKVRRLIATHGFKSKREKSKTFSAHAAKPITGTVVVGDEIRLPNSRYKQMRDARALLSYADAHQKDQILLEIRGRELEAAQVLRANSINLKT